MPSDCLPRIIDEINHNKKDIEKNNEKIVKLKEEIEELTQENKDLKNELKQNESAKISAEEKRTKAKKIIERKKFSYSDMMKMLQSLEPK